MRTLAPRAHAGMRNLTAKGPAGVVPAGAIVSLEVPIAGIASVTNFDATVLGSKPESDEELRALVGERLRALGISDPKQVGRLVGDVMKSHKGQADAADVKRIAEELLKDG